MTVMVVRSVFAYLMILAALRWMGKRQLGELQPSELVSTILISNLASVCIEDPSLPFLYSVVPVFVIAAAELVNSGIAFKSQKYARLLSGKPVIVVQNGTVDQQKLLELRLTMNDLLEALRSNGIFSPEEIDLAIVEADGKLSVLRASSQGEKPSLPVIVDGSIIQDNLDYLKVSGERLLQNLQLQNEPLKNILLAMCDGESFCFTKKEHRRKPSS